METKTMVKSRKKGERGKIQKETYLKNDKKRKEKKETRTLISNHLFLLCDEAWMGVFGRCAIYQDA